MESKSGATFPHFRAHVSPLPISSLSFFPFQIQVPPLSFSFPYGDFVVKGVDCLVKNKRVKGVDQNSPHFSLDNLHLQQQSPPREKEKPKGGT